MRDQAFDTEVHLIGGGFTLEEATKLMHHEVVRKSDQNKAQSIETIGVISGVLSINDQIELVIQFYGGIEQFIKEEFEAQLIVTTKDD